MANAPNNQSNRIDLVIRQHNIHSIISNKIQLINYLETKNVHIYMATETWLLPTDLFFDGYAGAAILFKNNITYKPLTLPNFEIINAVAAITTNLPQDITFISVYVPAKKKTVSRRPSRW